MTLALSLTCGFRQSDQDPQNYMYVYGLKQKHKILQVQWRLCARLYVSIVTPPLPPDFILCMLTNC